MTHVRAMTAFAACQLALGIVNFADGNRWITYYLNTPFFILFASFALVAIVEVRRGHRKAARDRDDSGFATGGILSGSFAIGGPVSTGEATGTDSGLTETTADVPILAFKRCKLLWSPGGRFWLQSQYRGDPLALDGEADCIPTYYFASPPEPHVAPGVGCTCGFYAVTDSEHLVGYGSVLLDVELSGRVIVHERGYRAQHQRVLRARVEGCHYCGQTPSAFLVKYRQPKPSTPITTSLGFNGRSGGGGQVIYTQATGPDEALALCEAHITDDDITVPIDVVAARLNVPFECGVAEVSR